MFDNLFELMKFANVSKEERFQVYHYLHSLRSKQYWEMVELVEKALDQPEWCKEMEK